MSRRRYLSTEISLDKAVNRLATQGGDFAALLYTWMIPHAADDGTLPGDPEELMYTVAPGRRDKEPEDIAAALRAMVAEELIEWDGKTARFPASTFYKYQTYIKPSNRNGAKKQAQPEDSDDNGDTPEKDVHQRKSPGNKTHQRETPQNTVSSPVPVPPPEDINILGVSGVVDVSSSAVREESKPGPAAPETSTNSGVSRSFSMSKEQGEAVAEIVDITGDKKSWQDYAMLWRLAFDAGELDAWKIAVVTVKGKTKSATPADNIGAYAHTVIVANLERQGIVIPRKPNGDLAAIIRGSLASAADEQPERPP